MANARPTASSTKETTNYARLCRLLVDVGTQALRDTFDAIHAPEKLHTLLSGNKATLQSLRTRKIINPTEWGKLFPVIPTSVSTANFDTTLLIVLLRNICGLPSPATGWDTLPVVTDMSREADIARVKYFRNTVYAHAEHASVDDVTFNTYWQDIRDTLVRLGGVKYRAAIDKLETECMDPEIEDHYKELLNQWKKDEDNVKDKLNEIMKKLNDLKAANDPSENTMVSSEGKHPWPKETMHGPVMCTEKYHESEAVEYYCQECEVCICHKCSVLGHNQHNKMDIQQAAEQQKLQMTEGFEKAKAKLAVVEAKMKEQIELMKKTEEEISAAEKDVTAFAEEVIRQVREHETDIKSELAVFKDKQQGYHANYLEDFQLLATQLRSSVEYGEGILERNIVFEILRSGRTLSGCCEGLLSSQENEIFKPPHVTFLVNDEELGEVVVSHTDSSKSEAEGKGLREAEMGAETEFTVMTRDSEGNQFYNEEDQITVKICSPTGEDEEKNIKDCEDGIYTVCYKPNSVGLHEIAVKVNGKPLTGSPWSVQVTPHQYKFLYSFGSSGKGRGEFDSPCGIAVSERTGSIAVADGENKRVQLFDSEGKYLRTIGDKWTKRINEPHSVAFTTSGNVIVINGEGEQKYKMSLFTERGQFVKQISENVLDPLAVSVSNDGHMVVSDCGDSTVKVLSPDGTELFKSFSAPNWHDSGYPGLAIYHQDRYFACYRKSHCIKVFNKKGEFLYDIGSLGSGD